MRATVQHAAALLLKGEFYFLAAGQRPVRGPKRLTEPRAMFILQLFHSRLSAVGERVLANVAESGHFLLFLGHEAVALLPLGDIG